MPRGSSNQITRQDSLKLELAEAMDLSTLYNSKEFQQRLLPLLIKDSQQQWLDPLKFPNQEDFQRAYNLAYSKAQVARDLINFLAKQEARMKSIRNQIDAPEKSYVI
jgi:hypothetical protein